METMTLDDLKGLSLPASSLHLDKNLQNSKLPFLGMWTEAKNKNKNLKQKKNKKKPTPNQYYRNPQKSFTPMPEI